MLTYLFLQENQKWYIGDLNIKNYREFIPEGDDFHSVYLTLREISPGSVEGIEALVELEMQKNQAVEEKDFERAAKLKERIRNFSFSDYSKPHQN